MTNLDVKQSLVDTSLLSALLDVFYPEQLVQLAAMVHQVREAGHGTVTLHVVDHELRFIQPAPSVDVRVKPQK